MSADSTVQIRRRRSAPPAAGVTQGTAARGAAGAAAAVAKDSRASTPASKPAAPQSKTVGPAAGPAAEPVTLAKAVGIAGRGFRRPWLRLSTVWNAGTQTGIAFVCWLALAATVYTLDPTDPTAPTIFFCALYGALFFTLTPLIRVVSLQFAHSRLYQEAVGKHAARQAFMVASFIVLNGVLQLTRAWSGLTAALLFGVFVIVEIVALARR
jgi:hypothetical protein